LPAPKVVLDPGICKASIRQVSSAALILAALTWPRLLGRAYLAALTWPRSLGRDAIHRPGERDVARGDTASVMSGERHCDGLVDLRPFRMVVHLFRDERRAGHEPERLVEIGEDEGLDDGVASAHLAPAGELGEGSAACFGAELRIHGVLARARMPVSA